MTYLVLGMHKSGTTLLSQILHHSGINMVEERSVDHSYDEGFHYERESTRRLNESILDCSGSTSLDIKAPSALTMTANQRRVMRSIIADCDGEHGDDWGFKDPRACLTYPLWRSELGPHRIVAVHRSIDELWLRYRYHQWYRSPANPVRAWKLVNRWYEANSRLVDYVSSAGRDALVLDYRSLMTEDTEMARLEHFVGRSLSDQRAVGLYRNQATRRSALVRFHQRMVDRRHDRSAEEIQRALDGLPRPTTPGLP